MTLEIAALWWCYIAGATAAVGVYAVLAAWALDRLVSAFKVKNLILQYYWTKTKAEIEANRQDRLKGRIFRPFGEKMIHINS